MLLIWIGEFEKLWKPVAFRTRLSFTRKDKRERRDDQTKVIEDYHNKYIFANVDTCKKAIFA